MNEEWKSVVGYESLYVVSNTGKVKSIRTGKMLATQINNSGYELVSLNNNKRKLITVHRVVATAFIPPLPGRPQVNHKNGNKLDNSLENLEWVSRSENMQHFFSCPVRSKPTRDKARERMREVGRVYGAQNIADAIGIHPVSVELTCGSNKIQFPSLRKAAIHLGVDHKTVRRNIDNKIPIKGHTIQIMNP